MNLLLLSFLLLEQPVRRAELGMNHRTRKRPSWSTITTAPSLTMSKLRPRKVKLFLQVRGQVQDRTHGLWFLVQGSVLHDSSQAALGTLQRSG